VRGTGPQPPTHHQFGGGDADIHHACARLPPLLIMGEEVVDEGGVPHLHGGSHTWACSHMCFQTMGSHPHALNVCTHACMRALIAVCSGARSAACAWISARMHAPRKHHTTADALTCSRMRAMANDTHTRSPTLRSMEAPRRRSRRAGRIWARRNAHSAACGAAHSAARGAANGA